MPTQPYYVEGKRVPSVTTIIGSNLGWNKDPLMYWAWKQGTEGLDFRTIKEKAANAGTIAHDMIECDLKGVPYKPAKNADPELLELAQKAFKNYLNWKTNVKFEVIGLEVPLVHRVYKFGGCIDCIARVNGLVSLFDWKTSNSIHEDYIMQLAAYENMWNHNNPNELIEGGAYLLRIDKENGAWAFLHWDKFQVKDDITGLMTPAFDYFLALRKLHTAKHGFKRMVG